MKSLFIAMALLAMVATSCQNKTSQNHSGTHTHEDGTVHEGHAHDETVEQTSFKVNEETATKSCCKAECKDCKCGSSDCKTEAGCKDGCEGGCKDAKGCSSDCKADACCKEKAESTGCPCKKTEETQS